MTLQRMLGKVGMKVEGITYFPAILGFLSHLPLDNLGLASHGGL